MIIPKNHYDWTNNIWLDTYIDKWGTVTHLRSIAKPIKGYEDLYLVYDSGYVYSKISKKFLKPRNNGKGYLQVLLYKDKKAKAFYIHRLVAEAFIPNIFPNIEWDVDHINNDTEDNRAFNLQYVTRYDNIQLKDKRGTITMSEYQTSLLNQTPEELQTHLTRNIGKKYNYILRKIDKVASDIACAEMINDKDKAYQLQLSFELELNSDNDLSANDVCHFMRILFNETLLFKNKINEIRGEK